MICCLTPAQRARHSCWFGPTAPPADDEQSPRRTRGFVMCCDFTTFRGSSPRQRPDFSSVHSRVCKRWISGGNGLSRNSVLITSGDGYTAGSLATSLSTYL